MIGIYIDLPTSELRKRAKYTFQTLFSMTDFLPRYIRKLDSINNDDVLVFYSDNSTGSIDSTAKVIRIPFLAPPTYKENSRDVLINPTNSILWKGRNLPFLYSRLDISLERNFLKYEDSKPAVVAENKEVQFGFDIIMSGFYFLACQEEFIIEKRDPRGRFLASYSSRDKQDIKKPILNYYADILSEVIKSIYSEQDSVGTEFNNQRDLVVNLSHDVDNIYKSNFYNILGKSYRAMRGIISGDPSRSLQELRSIRDAYFERGNSYRNFNKYMQLEGDHGFRSSFYFLGGRRLGRYGTRYKIKDEKGIIKRLDKNGWEVGSHYSYYSMNNVSKISKERAELEETLEKEIYGGRSHYLNFEAPKSWKLLEEAGYKYDSSLGYPNTVGFRAGIAYPFRPYDLANEQIMDIVEIPLIIMDKALLNENGQNEEQCWLQVKEIVEEVRNVDGVLTILWHQSVLDEKDFPILSELYPRLLNYLDQINATVKTNREIAQLKKISPK